MFVFTIVTLINFGLLLCATQARNQGVGLFRPQIFKNMF